MKTLEDVQMMLIEKNRNAMEWLELFKKYVKISILGGWYAPLFVLGYLYLDSDNCINRSTIRQAILNGQEYGFLSDKEAVALYQTTKRITD